MKLYKLVCKECGDEFELELSQARYESGEHRKYCSYTCSNSRIQTESMNEKRKRKLTKYGYETRICPECNKLFKVKQNSDKRFCSVKCSGRNAIKLLQDKNLNWSEIALESYRNGKRKPRGDARVEWFIFKDIKVQGTYELRVCYILDIWKEIGKIKDWEYTWDRFDYKSIDRKEHSYFPDFKVFDELNAYYIEVKGRINEIDLLKWEAVRKSGYKLEIWRLEIIKKHENDYGIKICSRRQRKHIEP